MSGFGEAVETPSATSVESIEPTQDALIRDAVNWAYGNPDENAPELPIERKISAALDKVENSFDNVSWIKQTFFGGDLEEEGRRIVSIFSALNPGERKELAKQSGSRGNQLFISRVRDTFGEDSVTFAMIDELLLEDFGNNDLRKAVRIHSLIAQVNDAHERMDELKKDEEPVDESESAQLEQELLQEIGEIEPGRLPNVRREYRLRYGDTMEEDADGDADMSVAASTAIDLALNDDASHAHELLREFNEKAQHQKDLGEFLGIYLGPYILGGMPRVIENWNVGYQRDQLEDDLVKHILELPEESIAAMADSYEKSFGESLRESISQNSFLREEAKELILNRI